MKKLNLLAVMISGAALSAMAAANTVSYGTVAGGMVLDGSKVGLFKASLTTLSTGKATGTFSYSEQQGPALVWEFDLCGTTSAPALMTFSGHTAVLSGSATKSVYQGTKLTKIPGTLTVTFCDNKTATTAGKADCLQISFKPSASSTLTPNTPFTMNANLIGGDIVVSVPPAKP